MQLSFEEAYDQYLKYVDVKQKFQSKRMHLMNWNELNRLHVNSLVC